MFLTHLCCTPVWQLPCSGLLVDTVLCVATICLLFFKMDRQYNNTIKVQRVFSFDACRIQFIARSLKYARYVFNQAPRGHQRALKQKSPTAEKKEIFWFYKAVGCGNTGRISRTTTQQNRTIYPLGGALYSYCIGYPYNNASYYAFK